MCGKNLVAALRYVCHEFIGQFIERYRSLLWLWKVKSEYYCQEQLKIVPIVSIRSLKRKYKMLVQVLKKMK